jgi:hypothetical protein|nr:MAG TPA: hypothetical protein [Caudoviricetes sp.]
MFKHGQLVKTKDCGYGVIVRGSKIPGRYFLTNPYWDFDMWFYEYELTLIGNNFKFKGAK